METPFFYPAVAYASAVEQSGRAQKSTECTICPCLLPDGKALQKKYHALETKWRAGHSKKSLVSDKPYLVNGTVQATHASLSTAERQ